MGAAVPRTGEGEVLGVCALVHVEVPVPGRAGLCKKLYVTSKCVCLAETQLPGSSPPQYTHLQGLEGRGWPPCLPLLLRRDFPSLAGAAGVGGPVKGFGSLWVLLFFPV